MSSSEITEKRENQQKQATGKKIVKFFAGGFLIVTILIAMAMYFTKSIVVSAIWGEKETFESIIIHRLTAMDEQKKLVVFTQEVDIEVSDEDHPRFFYDYFPKGSATVKMRLKENRVQYYIPLDEIKLDTIEYDPNSRVLTIFAPQTRIDNKTVFVQTDPAKITIEENGSWNPWGPKTEDLKNKIRESLKQEVLRAASHPLVREKADREAEKALQQLFNNILDAWLKGNSSKLQIIMPNT